MAVATHKLALLLVVVLVAVVASSSESTFDESTSQAVSEQQEPQQMLIQSRSLLGIVKEVKVEKGEKYASVRLPVRSSNKGVIAKGIAIAGKRADAYVSATSPKLAVAKAVAKTRPGGTATAYASARSSSYAHSSAIAISG